VLEQTVRGLDVLGFEARHEAIEGTLSLGCGSRPSRSRAARSSTIAFQRRHTLDSVVGLVLRSVRVLNELTKLRDSLVDLQLKGINEVTCPLDMFVRSQVLKFLASHLHFEGTESAST
jgi:hypothetical protein